MKPNSSLFLLGSFVAAIALVMFFRSFFAKRGSQFRDDLWAQQKRAEVEKKRVVAEDQVDRKILLEHQRDPAEPQEGKADTRSKIPFSHPNFRGQPHEVLGIALKATAEEVNAAFKYWIKRYHPDRVTHLGGKVVEQARRRAEQLNAARQEMLRRFAK